MPPILRRPGSRRPVTIAPACGTNWSRSQVITATGSRRGGGLAGSGLAFRTRTVLLGGLVASVPWLALVWLAHALAVAAAIVNSGALRVTFITAHLGRGGEFPPSNVLLYGAFFAVLLSVITVPLVASWRSCAFGIVERAHPLPDTGEPGEEWFPARARLEKLLHLDVPLLRNPLTALGVLTPLITAALAAFIPQLGNG